MITIARNPEVVVFRTEDLTYGSDDIDSDVEVIEIAARWSASFVTVKRLERYFLERAVEDKNTAPYFWCDDLIVVPWFSYDVVLGTIRDLRQSGKFADAFTRLDD